MKRATLIIAVLALALAGSAVSASAYTRGCHYPFEGGYGPINDRSMNIGNLSVRNMRCRDALHAINVSRLLRSGDIRTPHFGCRKLRTYSSGGTILGAIIRCVHSSPYRAFRFSWAT
jgi:hypothetical protein